MERPEPRRLNRRRLLIAGLAGAAATPSRADNLDLKGRLVQGGYAIGRGPPGAELVLNDQNVGRVSPGGWFFIGFDRDEPKLTRLRVRTAKSVDERRFHIAPGTWDVQRVDGLPQDTVTPSDPALLDRIKREAAIKAAAFASVAPGEGFRDGFGWPLEHFRISGHFGNQRVLNGTPTRPHYGIDLAAPTGSVIHAPAPGLVVLAEPRLHYEGGLTMIDHGQGLVSCYLHQSRQLVAKGQAVIPGQPIGAVGMTGRATGPHLCWRLKWRGRNLDPSLLIGAATAIAKDVADG